MKTWLVGAAATTQIERDSIVLVHVLRKHQQQATAGYSLCSTLHKKNVCVHTKLYPVPLKC